MISAFLSALIPFSPWDLANSLSSAKGSVCNFSRISVLLISMGQDAGVRLFLCVSE